MPTPTTERHLATVIKADIVAYTRLMGEHEDITMAAWWACRNEIIDPQILAFRGKIVKHTGDGFLAEFPSALDATNCAIKMQTGLERRNRDIQVESQITFRMGLNLCDVLTDEEDIYGDGVNIAARVETLAEPGGICITSAVHDQVKSKISVQFESMGQKRLKHVTFPVTVFQILPPERTIVGEESNDPDDEANSIDHSPSAQLTGPASVIVIFACILVGVLAYLNK